MSSLRRACVVLLAVGMLGSLSLWQSASAQKMILRDQPPKPVAKLTAAISLSIDADANNLMGYIRSKVAGEEWPEAVEGIQKMLNRKSDGLVYASDTAEKSDDTVSGRYEANRLLGTLPLEALKFYEDLSGATAAALVGDAKKQESIQERRRILGDVVQKYMNTKAGAAALEMLATDRLERGDFQEAALRFGQRLSLRNTDVPTPQTLLKAGIAFSRVDDKTINREEHMRLLVERARQDGGVRVAQDLLVSVDQINSALNKANPNELNTLAEWPMMRGNYSRSAQGNGSDPHLEPSWVVNTLPEKADNRAWVEDYLRQAVAHLESRGMAILPAFHPIAVNGKVIFRTYDGFWLVNLREANPDYRNMYQSTDGGAMAILGDPNKKTVIDPWKASYLPPGPGPHGILFENSVTGTLTTDSIRAYLVDDLLIPPSVMRAYQMGMMGMRVNYGHLNDQAYRNSLKSYNLESFKLLWDLGGKTPSGNDKLDRLLGVLGEDGKAINGNQAGSFFLGPPLPLNGKLYVLNERGGEVRLLCLEPKDKETDKVPPPPDLVWSQKLVQARDSADQDFNRRIHAAHLAYGEGILICPTHAGAMIGVDLLSHSVVWIHRYREGVREVPQPGRPGFPPGINPQTGQPLPSTSLINEWKSTPPVITEGKVLFAAPDGNALHCLSLQRGKLLWKVNRATDDLYFAGVYDGKALIVSKNNVRAYHIADGKEAWNIPNTGVPSGQGVASQNIYYLPVKASANNKNPEILAINLEKGVIRGRTEARTKRPDGKLQEPGNLIFYEGQVISQTLTSVVSYPQINAKMAESDERLRKNPRDPLALLERGELRLGKGELNGAISDLHLAMEVIGPVATQDAFKPLVPRVRTKLYDSLTQMFEVDFDAAEKYLDEYKELCKSDNADEQLSRLGDYYSRLAKGREKQSRLQEAFDAYMKFGELVGDRKLVRVSDQMNTEARPDVWARGRIGAMMAAASPEKRKPLEEKITSQWNELKDNDDLEKLEHFVALFGSAFESGKQAKLRLAERLMAETRADKVQDAQLRAQLFLLQLRELRRRPGDQLIAGRAVETLARLMIQKNELAHAAAYYKELGRDFAGIVLREGKTGGDLYNEIVVDKRFLPYLESPRPAWRGTFKTEKVNGGFNINPAFTLEPTGEVLPFFERNRLALEVNSGQLRFIDPANPDKPAFQTPALPLNHYFNNYQNQGVSGHAGMRFTYSTQGHVVVLNLGHMVYAFDPIDKRKLWEYNLYEPGTATNPNVASVIREANGQYMIYYADGWKQRLGQVGAVQANYVCLQTRKGLVALDPIKGPASILWTKSDVSTRSSIFGDDQYIFVVDVNNEGKPTSAARAVRAADGVTIGVPDFADIYARQLRIQGRTILAQEESAKGEFVLRQYDILAGKDIWQKTFPKDSLQLVTQNTEFAGVVDPTGVLTVVEMNTGKEAFKATIKKEDRAKMTDGYLLADRDSVYAVVNVPAEAIPGLLNRLMTNVHPTLSTLPVNGPIYAFDRNGGKTRWVNTVTNQQMIVEQFHETPLMLFTVKYHRNVNGQFRFVQVIEAIDKHNGKFAWPLLEEKEMIHQTQQPFHSLRCDARTGLVVLEQFNFQMKFQLTPAEAK